MNNLVLEAADIAIHNSYAAVDPNQNIQGSLRDKNVSNWSFRIFILGTILGAIVSIAAYVMALTPLIIVGGLLCLTNGLAAYDIKKFGILKTLEDYTKVLTQRVQELAEVVLNLKSENNDLKRVTMQIKNIPEEWQRAIEEGGVKLFNKTKALEAATNKLNIAESKLDKFASLTDELRQQSEKISETIVNYTQQNQILGPEVDKIGQHLSDFQAQNSTLADHITKLDEENKQLEEVVDFYEKQNKFLENTVNLMLKIDADAREQVSQLESEIKDLNSSTVQSQNVVKELQLFVPKLQQKLQQMKNFKDDPEYKEFKEWQSSQK